MIKLEKTTKTNLKAKGLQMANNSIIDVDTGEVVDINTILTNTFGTEYFDLQVTTSTKEESEVDTGEPAEFDPEAEEY